jgi:predicted GTPase
VNYDNSVTKFAVIGKANKGKSSIISAVTFDDSIEVADEIGTTTEFKKYEYRDEKTNKPIAIYFDTPGFESAEQIYFYIKKNKTNIPSIKQILEKFIYDYSYDDSLSKDIEILKAIIESDFLVFVVNVSEKFNKNVIGYELEILKELRKRVVIIFNQIDKENYSNEWEKELKKYDLTNIHKIDLLNAKYSNIIDIFKSLYSIEDSDIYDTKQLLNNVINAYKNRYKNNLERTAELIAKYLKEVLQIEINVTKKEHESGRSYEFIKKEIDKKEKKLQDTLSILWGYREVKVEDKRDRFDAKTNVEMALSKNEKAIIGAIIGATVVGTTTGTLSGGLGAPAGAGLGAFFGALLGYFSDVEMFDVKPDVFKKDVKITISPKDIDLSIILITRILEFVETIIEHGHANRNKVIVSKIEKRDFSISEIKFIAKIHSSFVENKNIYEYQNKLKEFILKILKKDLKVYDF